MCTLLKFLAGICVSRPVPGESLPAELHCIVVHQDCLGPELHVVPVDGDAVAAAQRLQTHPGLAAPHPRVQPRHLPPLQDDGAPGVPAHRELVL